MSFRKFVAAAAALVLALTASGAAALAAEAPDATEEVAPHVYAESALDPATSEIRFEESAIDTHVISAFSENETPINAYLGGVFVYVVDADGHENHPDVDYEWYEADKNGKAKGDVISREEFLSNDGETTAYDPTRPGEHYYVLKVFLDGKEVGSQLFSLYVVDGLQFDLTASADSVSQGPVTVTANIPEDQETQLAAAVMNMLPEEAQTGLHLDPVMSYWSSGRLDVEEGFTAEGQPVLTVQPFVSANGHESIRYIVEYGLISEGHYGMVRIYSHPCRLHSASAGDGPGGESANLFQSQPLSETELRKLYDTLIAPYHDPTSEDPFALRAARTDDTGMLTASSQNELLSLINFIRRCAGVNSLTGIDSRKAAQAQAGAEFMSTNVLFGHAVAEGKDPEAHEGLMRSNLSNGWWKDGSPYDFIRLQLTQFYSNNAKTMPAVATRQQLLDNRLTTTGFGYAAPTADNKRTYLVTHVDGSEIRTGTPSSLEAFPGVGAFPVELLNFKGWSLGLGNGWSVPNPANMTMTITREDGESWKLSRLQDPSTAYDAKGDWFCVDTTDVGSGPIIVFSPASIFKDGDINNTDSLIGHTYTIQIDGVVNANGEEVDPIEYSTQFVSLKQEVTAQPTPSASPSADASASASAEPSGSQSIEPSPTPSASPSESPSAQPSETASAGPSESPAGVATRRPSSGNGLADFGIENINGTDYVTGIAVSTKAYDVGEILAQAAQGIDHADGQTFQIVKNATGRPLADDKLVGTGCLLQIVGADDAIVRTLPIVIDGDVSGSGKIDIVQLTSIARHINGQAVLEGTALLAGDLNGNGNVDILDLTKVAKLLVSGS